MAQSTVTTAQLGAGSVPPEKTIYTASGGRKTMLSFVFLLLLPFFVSLPIMLWQRISNGAWEGVLPLSLLGLAFLAIMFLVIVELTVSLWSRVELGKDTVKLRLPAARHGPTPLLRYRSHDIPYDQIASVEVRREVYGGSLAPVIMKGARVRTKDNKVVKLGFVSEANVDATFPYPVIAHQIAARAGVPVKEEGNVWRAMRLTRKKAAQLQAAQGLTIDPQQPLPRSVIRELTDEDIGKLNTTHKRLVLGLVNVLVTLVLVGIAMDFMAETDAQRKLSATASAISTLAPTPAKKPPSKPAPAR